jgi:hypothetical protein
METKTINPYKALERISFRFGSGKAFKPNEHDIVAFNGLVEFFEKYQRREIVEHKLFAKLYIHVYTKFLIHYGTTPDDPIPQKELHEILNRRFDRLLHDLEVAISSNDLDAQIKSGAKTIVQSRWGFEEIKYNINMQIAKAIEEFK